MSDALLVGLAVLIALHVVTLGLLWLRRPLASLEQPKVDLSPVREAVAEQAAALQRVVDQALHATLPQAKPAKPHAPQFVLRSQETTGRVARSIYVCEAEGCGHIYYADTPLEGGA